MTDRPPIVCLVGSTRFYEAFRQANFDETLAGKIVLTIGFYPRDDMPHWQNHGITPDQKEALDALHLKKVAMADEVHVLNCGGYVGESTAREIAYAMRLGKRIRYLEPTSACPAFTEPSHGYAALSRSGLPKRHLCVLPINHHSLHYCSCGATFGAT
jgi:hypothetical protein